MRKDQLHRRSKDAEATNDVSGDVENGDPLSGSADPFDTLVNSKNSESTQSNGKSKSAPSPIPDSDTENDKTDNDETKNDDDDAKSGENSFKSAQNGENDDDYEVEDIVDHKFKGKKKYFKIRWKNYDEKDDTWQLEAELDCPEIIERYLAAHPEAVGEKTVKKEKKEKKVRISLPPTREVPKRTAAERKSITDDPDDDDDEPKKKAEKKGRSKKGKKSAAQKEYEVLKIVDDEMRSGKKYYRIRWKGWSAKDDTWEPKTSLTCPDLIKSYEENKTDTDEYEVEKIVGEKIERGVRYFLVKWKGWSEEDNSWEKNVDCYDLIEKFRDSCRSASKSNKRPAVSSPKSAKAKKSRKVVSDDDDDDNNDDDDDDAGDDEKEWEVEKIVNVRNARAGKKEYLIRWKGCKAAEDTWEPETSLTCPDLIAAFVKKNKK